MKETTKYYLFWGLLGMAVIMLIGYLIVTHRPQPVPAPPRPREEPVIPAPIADIPEDATEEFQPERGAPLGELQLLMPVSPVEGQPFVLTDASEHANRGFKFLREKRFQEALAEYQSAARLDPRYELALKRTEDLVREINRVGVDAVKNRRVFPGDNLTYRQLYGWE